MIVITMRMMMMIVVVTGCTRSRGGTSDTFAAAAADDDIDKWHPPSGKCCAAYLPLYQNTPVPLSLPQGSDSRNSELYPPDDPTHPCPRKAVPPKP